jgi:hypothetical protein
VAFIRYPKIAQGHCALPECLALRSLWDIGKNRRMEDYERRVVWGFITQPRQRIAAQIAVLNSRRVVRSNC